MHQNHVRSINMFDRLIHVGGLLVDALHVGVKVDEVATSRLAGSSLVPRTLAIANWRATWLRPH